MSENAPNFNPASQEQIILENFRQTQYEAGIADSVSGIKPAMEHDTLLAQQIEDNKGNRASLSKDNETLTVNVNDSERTAISQNREDGAYSAMQVTRGEKNKILESDNPLVRKMLADIALKSISKEATKRVEWQRSYEEQYGKAA